MFGPVRTPRGGEKGARAAITWLLFANQGKWLGMCQICGVGAGGQSGLSCKHDDAIDN